MTTADMEYRSDYELTNTIPYLIHKDDLWSVFGEYFG